MKKKFIIIIEAGGGGGASTSCINNGIVLPKSIVLKILYVIYSKGGNAGGADNQTIGY